MLSRLIFCVPVPASAECDLRAYLEQRGPLDSLWVACRAQPPYARATYTRVEDAQRLLAAGREQVIGTALVEFAPGNAKPELLCFITNVDHGVSEQELWEVAASAGKVVSVKILLDANGVGRGVAFVSYEHESEVATALSTLPGVTIRGRQIGCRDYKDDNRGRKDRQGAVSNDTRISSTYTPPALPPVSLSRIAPGRFSNTPAVGSGDRLVYSTPELPPEPRMPLRYKEAPEIPYTRRKGSRRRKDRQ